MTLSDLRTMLTNFLAYDLDNFSAESPSNAQLDAQLNHALRVISRELFLFDPQVSLNVKYNKARYNLDKDCEKVVVQPFYVTINGNKLWNAMADAYGMWGFEEFVHDHPTWEAASTGTPTKAVQYGSREILLHLPPSATIADATTNYVAGQVLAKELVADSDSPSDSGVPVEIHEAIAYMAAVHAAKPNASAPEAWQRLSEYNRDWKEMARVIRNENMRLYHSGTRRSMLWADYIEL